MALNIGIDIDNTILDMEEMAFKLFKACYDIDCKMEQLTSYEKEQCYPWLTREMVEAIYVPFHTYWAQFCKPLPGAIQTVNWYYQFCRIHLITARTLNSDKITHDWLEKHGVKYDSLTFATDKLKACQDLNVTLMIEDKGETTQLLAENGVECILLDYPWNRKFEHALIQRAKDWHEAFQLLKAKVHPNHCGEPSFENPDEPFLAISKYEPDNCAVVGHMTTYRESYPLINRTATYWK